MALLALTCLRLPLFYGYVFLLPYCIAAATVAAVDVAATASHNARSLEKAAALLRRAEREIGPAVSRKVTFGQLYGMGDAISHGLVAGGFSVFKYLPFGPVDKTIPYLVRRAQENGGMLGGARNEVRYLLNEVKRRLAGGKQLQ